MSIRTALKAPPPAGWKSTRILGPDASRVLFHPPGAEADVIVPQLEPGECVHVITESDLTLTDVAYELAERYGPLEIDCATWRADPEWVEPLKILHDAGFVTRLSCLVDPSCRVYCAAVPGEVSWAEFYLNSCHAKVFLFRSATMKIVWHGSANLAGTDMLEHHVVTRDDATYDGWHAWMSALRRDSPRFHSPASVV